MHRADCLWPRGRALPIGLACGLVALLGVPSCRSGSERTGSDGQAVSCARACQALVQSGCDRDGSRPGDAARCAKECSAGAVLAEQAGCVQQRLALLDCAARQRLDCSAACGAASCLERGEGLAACAEEHGAFERCRAPCQHAGVTSLVNRPIGGALLQAELVRAGCGACPQLESRAPAGAPCQAASVCSQVCCGCAEGRARYLARVCLDGACADAERGCDAVRRSGQDPCR